MLKIFTPEQFLLLSFSEKMKFCQSISTVNKLFFLLEAMTLKRVINKNNSLLMDDVIIKY